MLVLMGKICWVFLISEEQLDDLEMSPVYSRLKDASDDKKRRNSR